MVSIPLALVIAFVVALALTPLVRRLAPKIGGVDLSGQSFRKAHAESIPRLGGVAIVIAFYVPLIGLLLVDSGMGVLFKQDLAKTLGLMVGGLPIVALGIYDDTAGAGAIRKLMVQVLVALSLYVIGFRIGIVSTPFGFTLPLGIFALPVTVLWIVGLINAMNLIDGLDGLAGGVAFFAGAATLAVAYFNGNHLMMLFMATLCGAVAGFLIFNFNPATIFMGDTGSMFLGYVIAVTSLQTSTKGAATVALMTPVLALGLPIMDTLVAVARRALRGQALFQGDRDHVHHRLIALGLTHRQAVLVLYAVSLLFGLVALAVTYLRGPQTTAVLVGSGLVIAIGVRVLWRSQQGQQSWRELRHKNKALRGGLPVVLDRMALVEDHDALWLLLREGAQLMGAHELHLWQRPAEERATPSASRTWIADPLPEARPRSRRLELPNSGASLELGWRDGLADFPAQEQNSLEQMVQVLDDALTRMDAPSGKIAAVIELHNS